MNLGCVYLSNLEVEKTHNTLSKVSYSSLNLVLHFFVCICVFVCVDRISLQWQSTISLICKLFLTMRRGGGGGGGGGSRWKENYTFRGCGTFE